jgi:hypothetical protein
MSDSVVINVDMKQGGVVALRSVRNPLVLASGRDVKSVMNKLSVQDTKEPVLFFVPKKNARLVY